MIVFAVSFHSDRHDALFVVGSLDETLELRGLRYHPIDIETSVSRAHRSIAERWGHFQLNTNILGNSKSMKSITKRSPVAKDKILHIPLITASPENLWTNATFIRSLSGLDLLPYSAVFTWTNLLVVVSELCGSEQDALDLVPLITNVVLEEHHLIVGVVVIVDPGVIPINSRGEKQRMHLRDSFLADQLDPIYVAYNM